MQSRQEEIGITHFASAVKSNIIDFSRTSGRSFIKMKNSSGPSILPCGTPEITGKVLDTDWPTETH